MSELEKTIESKLSFPHGEIRVFDSIDSTNSFLKREYDSLTNWSIAVSLEQTGGKGRRGHTFSSQRGGVYFSILLKPQNHISDLQTLTACVGVCVCDAVIELTGLSPQIKWVNDILIDKKKICGILCESVISPAGEVEYIICGIGINIDRPKNDFPVEIAETAGALSDFCIPPNKGELVAGIVNRFHGFAPNFASADFIDSYRLYSCVVGNSVKVFRGGENTDAFAVAIDDDASLLIRREDGVIEKLNSGDISIKL